MTELKKPKQHWWQIALTIIAVALSGAAAKYCTQEAVQSGRRALTPQKDVEAMLDRQADTNPALSAFRQSFPQDWAVFREASSADVKSSISANEVKTRAVGRMRRFMLEKAAWTAAAPSSDLNAVLSAEAAFIQQLSTDSVEVCARYGMSGLSGAETLSADALRLLNDVVMKRVVATRQGRDQAQRYGEITAEDADALVDGMTNAGADQAVIDLMLSDPSVGTPDQQCEGTVALYRSIDAMPDNQAARVYAMILRAAVAEQTAQAR